MTRTTMTRTIDAPLEDVFNTVADISQYSEAVPHIVKIEFLTESKTGVGTRFRETRLMKGKEAATELEVTEYVENDRVRMVADSHGTVWDSLFTVRSENGKTNLTLIMEARAYKFLPRLMNPLIKGMVAKAVGMDMDMVKAHCENQQK
ncbi:SRPBCC family protein [Gimesia aquarii]|uniref:Polyketide cyclase / dehydrase and lipid transport n=1 Tax=Gimesia aquarii TaxID=2527964 RepID=A0A517WP46_9PLAN|nr:SRPBCC family protein [Gimesia aquarii]QDU07023.1 Polyketide cyclase / dehydrase and lipid transport [Gimesia aquarii]